LTSELAFDQRPGGKTRALVGG